MRYGSRPVVESFEDEYAERCVDLVLHADGSVSIRECRRDPEDGGRWTVTRDHAELHAPDREVALTYAIRHVDWLAEALRRRKQAG